MFTVKIIVALAVLEHSTSLFGISFVEMREGMEKARRELIREILMLSSANEQFPWNCKARRVTVIYVNVGPGWVKTANRDSYTGGVQQNADVEFITEQDGSGDILAKFNGEKLTCDGVSSMKQRTCTIPSHLKPWTGTITVEILWGPSTSFRMSGKPYCPNPGFTGYNCRQDINECEVYTNEQICEWEEGCVNTHGSYRCRCPTGYTVSSTDFRLCNEDRPKIWSPPGSYIVVFFQTATLPCRHTASGPVIIQWQIDNNVIAIKRSNGEKEIGSPRLTLHDDGDLSIKNVTFGDEGKFTCTVHNTRFHDTVTHDVQITTKGATVDIPKILNPPSNYTFMLFQTATLPCRYNASSPVIIKWQMNSTVVAIRRLNGTKQTADNLMTLHDNGDLSISRVTYGYTGKYSCIVQNDYFGTYVTHILNIESSPVMDIYISGTEYTDTHPSEVYRAGDNVTLDTCHLEQPSAENYDNSKD